MERKSLSNTSIADVKATTSDVQVFGNGDLFQLICKASSKTQGWMKSTKAMQLPFGGCVVQVTSEFRGPDGQITGCAEAVTFVPNVAIRTDEKGNKYLG